MKTDKWIIDGHFKSSIEDRIKNADSIIYFNLNGKVCVNGVKHRIKYHSIRDDMPCVEKVLDKEFEYTQQSIIEEQKDKPVFRYRLKISKKNEMIEKRNNKAY